jgi:two-component system, cell cycle response regulator
VRILLADDDRVSRRLLQLKLVQWGFEVAEVSDGTAAWAALRAPDGPRLAILDWMMPGLDGIEVCRRVRERAVPYIYVVIITAKDRKEDIVAALEAGADDFLTKPFDAFELKARLRTGARILELQESLLEAQDALRYEATHDGLTGVANRATIMDLLRREMDRAEREGTHLGLVLLDIDHFKKVNDTHGHGVGDTVLRETSRHVRRSLRPYDHLGRIGGEEFLLVLPGCDAAALSALAERIREGIARNPVTIEGTTVPLTVSLGTASSRPGGASPDRRNVELLVRAADAALYRAKEGGRDRVEPARPQDFGAGGAGPEG